MTTIKTDICVIGAGSAGLSMAAGAVQMGARVVLIEGGDMGGDCLNSGCIPSKSLLAAAKRAALGGRRLGVDFGSPQVDFAAVNDHVHAVIAEIAPHDSQERFEELGVTVIRDMAHFVSRRELVAGDHRIHAKRFVIATGSRPFIPPLPGLDKVDYYTNETIFGLRQCPGHLIVIGGGPIGVEMAQAHRRLGAEVTLVQRSVLLPKDDVQAVAVVAEQLTDEGVQIVENAQIQTVTGGQGHISITVDVAGVSKVIEGTHLLIATGRAANVDGLGLDDAGVRYGSKGVIVDARLRTSNKRIYALGDVTGGYQFTHMAGYDAGIAIRNILFRLPAKVSHKAVPWVTYSDPELAHVGLTQADAKAQNLQSRVLIQPFADIDRARAEGETAGFLKVMVGAKGAILGATCVGPHAGDLIQPWTLAMNSGLKIKHMADHIVPYPTRAEVSKRAAGQFYKDFIFSSRVRRIVRLLLKLP